MTHTQKEELERTPIQFKEPQIYDPLIDPYSAENKVKEYRRRARTILDNERPDGNYFTNEVTITAQMLQLEEIKKD